MSKHERKEANELNNYKYLKETNPMLLDKLKLQVSNIIASQVAQTGSTPSNKTIRTLMGDSLEISLELHELEQSGIKFSRNFVSSLRASLEDKKPGY